MFLKTVGNIARSVGGGLLDEARDTFGKLRDPIGTVKQEFQMKFGDPEKLRQQRIDRLQAFIKGELSEDQLTNDEREDLMKMGLIQSRSGRLRTMIGGLLTNRNEDG